MRGAACKRSGFINPVELDSGPLTQLQQQQQQRREEQMTEPDCKGRCEQILGFPRGFCAPSPIDIFVWVGPVPHHQFKCPNPQKVGFPRPSPTSKIT